MVFAQPSSSTIVNKVSVVVEEITPSAKPSKPGLAKTLLFLNLATTLPVIPLKLYIEFWLISSPSLYQPKNLFPKYAVAE